MRTIYSAMIYRQYAATGSPEAGYDWLKKLDANTAVYTPTPDDMYLKLDRGVGTVTLWNLQDAFIQPMKNNRPWSFVIPTSGVPVLLDGVGVVNNPKSNAGCYGFRELPARTPTSSSARKGLLSDSGNAVARLPPNPTGSPSSNIKEMKIDWDLAESEADRVDELLVAEHQG